MTAAEAITYLRSQKGGKRKRDGRSFTEWKFGELCECIGFEAARGFVIYTERWNKTALIVSTYNQFIAHENSSRNSIID